MNEIKVSAQKLRQFCADCFEKLGVSSDHSRLIADNLLFANLRGVDSHGLIRLKVYCERLKVGGFNIQAQAEIVSEDQSVATVDGQHGTGQVAASMAMNLAIGKAQKTGIAWVSVKNSNHFGACAFYALQPVKHGMIGFAATNAGPTMAPTGGREARLGNNAFAVAVPAGRHPPVVLDMATGAVAWGKIFVAQQEKRKIPATWALDKHGQPTDDPNAAADKGLIQPLGGYKGYGLSLFLDVFTGILSGGGFSTQVKTLYQQVAIPADVAHTCAALRVDAFMPLKEFRERIDAIIELMQQCPKADGIERVYVPGEIEHETEQRRKVEGIPINGELQQELRVLAAQLNVQLPF